MRRRNRVATCVAAGLLSLLPVAAGAQTPSDTIQVTVPTSISCTLMEDGTVVAPTGLSVENGCGEAIVMDAYTSDSLGHSLGYSLDADGRRVLTRSGGRDDAPELGFDVAGGASVGLRMNVDALDAATDGEILDGACKGGTDLFELGFRFNMKRLHGAVPVTKGPDGSFHAEATGTQSDAAPSYQWYRSGTTSHTLFSDEWVPGLDRVRSRTFHHGGGELSLDWVNGDNNEVRNGWSIDVVDAGGDERVLIGLPIDLGHVSGQVPEGDYCVEIVNTDPLEHLFSVEVGVMGDAPIDGAVGMDYAPRDDDLGKSLYCKVTDGRGKYTGELVSEAAVCRDDKLKGVVSASSGGGKVTASVTGAPADAQLRYQWYRKGQKKDVVADSWDFQPWETTKNLEVPVSGDEVSFLLERNDYRPLMRSVFLSVDAVGGERLYYGEAWQCVNVPTPIRLDGGVGRLSFGLTNGDNSPHSFSLSIIYPYQVDEAIPGATGREYVPTASDKDMSLYCKVTDSSGRYVGELVSNEVASPVSLADALDGGDGNDA